MKKSYARRLMLSCSLLVLCSILILDGMLMMFVLQYFKQDKYDLLSENVDTAYTTMVAYLDEGDQTDTSRIQPLFEMLAAAIDANFALADENGSFILCATGGRDDASTLWGNSSGMPVDMMTLLQEKEELYDSRNFGGLYNVDCYSYARIIYRQDGSVRGYLIASIPIKLHLHDFMLKMLKMCLTASIPVLLLTCVISYMITQKMVKPLRLAADVAEKIGKGDFTARLPEDSTDEIGVLMHEMNNMAAALAANDSSQRSFIANVSHELKTPMTSISGFVDGILDGTIPPEKQQYYLRIVSDEVKRLSRLVRSMLNLSKIEAGEMQLQPKNFNILDTVIQVVLSFEQRIEEHHIEIKGLDIEPLYVSADADLIYQVVYNLVENAVKFTNENGYIAFDIYRKESRVYVAIQNSGMGLTKEELDNVFKRFYKSDRSRGLDKTGFGLGLYLVRSIVAMHGSEVEVESIEGEYCRFTFSLAEAPEAIHGKRWMGKGPRVTAEETE